MERQQKKESIREKIIKACYELLIEKNWEMISSNEICKKASISKRTLYIYFRSLEELYLELVVICFTKLNFSMGEAFKAGNSDVDKIINLGRAYLTFMNNFPEEGRLLVRFDEMLYIENYAERVKQIGVIANQFELLTVFRQLNMDEEKYGRPLAICLWAHIQGVARLFVNKKLWIESYYKASVDSLIEEQLEFIRRKLLYTMSI